MTPSSNNRLSFASAGLAVISFLILPTATAEQPDGNPQNLTSPDQVPEGLAKSDWASIRAAYEAGQHAFQPIEGGWQARNPGQQWTTKFDGRGFLAQPKGANWQWGLELRSYGFGEQQTPIGGVPAVKAAGQRLSYQWDTTVQEWWVNDKRGLEHGFTIKERPQGAPAPNSQPSTLNFQLATRGTLKPVITADALGVEFRNAAGATVLNYTGLKVWDADGKVLPSRFEAAGETSVRLLVEERGARYPLTIDPIAQQAYVKVTEAGSGAVSDRFGSSVAVSGDTVVVGATGEDSSTTGVNSTPNEGASNAGAVYVFVRSGTNWSQQAYLKAGQVSTADTFGVSVAVSGDTVVVGAAGEDSSTSGINSIPDEGATSAGAAYVFVRSGTNWSQQAYLKASQVSTNDQFGVSVAISGDTAVVGADREGSSTTGINSTPDELAPEAGAAYIFVRNGTNWSQEAYLKASQVTANDEFGYSVAVSGDTVVVGAWQEDSSTTGINNSPNEGRVDAGAAYVFVRNGTNWSQQAYLKASQVTLLDYFGNSVAVSGDTVVVGAHREDSSTTGINSTPNESARESGAAYVFVRNGVNWSQQAYLKASEVTADDNFGHSVAVYGDTVVVSAIDEDSSTMGINSTPDELALDAGAAFVFTRSGTTWSQQAYLKAGQVNMNDQFGGSVAISGDTVVVGMAGEDSGSAGIDGTPNEGVSSAGAAYVFALSGINWSQQAYVKPTGTGSGAASDKFGISVAVSGDTVVVGAVGEDSSTTGINSAPDAGAPDAGAAYVFVRSGTNWSQQAYLKASQVSADDNFGISVAVSGDTVVVGAYLEDSSTTSINSTPDEGASAAGAVYVFVRSGTSWTQQAYLKANQVSTNDQFGVSVAISGDTAVVGAHREDSSKKGINSTPDELAAEAGAAYVFVRSGTNWSQQAYLKASQVNGGDMFGNSVAVSGDTVVVGADLEDSSTTGIDTIPDESASAAGAAYVFVRSGITWSQQAYLKASQVTAGDNFGASVAAAVDTVVVGAPYEDSSAAGINSTPDDLGTNVGAAYVFVRTGSSWSQQAYLKANQVNSGDVFGISVAVSGDTVVVGAIGEDSSTTGINSTPDDNGGINFNAGAVFVFLRSGMSWSQQAYLKASQITKSDQFGQSVAVSGDTVVVGAIGEDSSTTGINSTPDEGRIDAGAAYIFTGLGPLTPDIAVSQAGAVADTGSIDFGSVTLGSSAPLTFTITNPGTADLTGLAVTGGTSEFTVSALSATTVTSGGPGATFTVTFTPSVTGPRTTTLQIASNVTGTKNLYDITLTGIGEVPPTLSPVTIASNNANTTRAKQGDTVTVSFTASEPIQTPSVTLLGVAATVANPSGNNWTASATVGAGTEEGVAAFSITATDLAGSAAAAVATTTNASSVTVDVITQAPTLTTPATNAVTRSMVNVAFSLPEAALPGSVKLLVGATELTLASSLESTGAHSFSFNAANHTASPQIASGAAIPDGTYTVTLRYQDAVGNVASMALATNVAIDNVRPFLSFAFATFSHREDAVTVKVPVTLDVRLGSAFTVPFTVGGSAVVGVDATVSASPLKFTATQTTAFISIVVKDDLLVEGDDTITLTLGAPSSAGVRVISPSVLTLTIVEDDVLPVIMPDLLSRMVAVGDAVTFVSGATGSAPLTLKWKKGSVTLLGEIGTSLVLSPATLSAAAAYNFSATNQRGSDSSTAELAVVDRSDAIIRANAGTSPKLTVAAKGNRLSYRWRDANGDLPLTGSKYAGVTTATLTVKGAASGDTGHYTCRVTAPGGTLDSGDQFLQVPSLKPIANQPIFPDVVIHNSFSYQLTFDPDPSRAPTKFLCTGLPKGLTCHPTTGLISGKPTVTGDFTVTVTLSNAADTADTVQDAFKVLAYPEGAVGSYLGVIGRNTKANADLGGRIDFKTTLLGGYTGSLILGSSTLRLSGTLATPPTMGGHPGVTLTLARPSKLPVLLVLDLDPATNDLTGSVYEQGETGSNNLIGWRNTWTSNAPTRQGTHSFKIDPVAAIGPQGYGFGTIFVSATGVTTMKGQTADAGVVLSSGLLGPDGEVLVYAPMLSNKASLLGTLSIGADTNHSIDNSLSWQKIAASNPREYAPFGPLTVPVKGGLYVLESPVLGLTDTGVDNAQFLFSEAGVPSLTNPNVAVYINNTNKLTPSVTNPGGVKLLSFSASTGAFTGQFTLKDAPAAPRTVKFQGWLVPTESRGYGYFLLPQLAAPPATSASTSPIMSGRVVLERLMGLE
jgi:hypothetical protein